MNPPLPTTLTPNLSQVLPSDGSETVDEEVEVGAGAGVFVKF
jgi:hypothetical protein